MEQSKKITMSGFPMIRAMAMHHPDDKLCWHIDDQYYFGDHFLVAPVMNSENQRDVYLPEGRWVSFFSGEMVEGGRWLKNIEVPLDEMPIYVEFGAKIPIYLHPVKSTDDIDWNKVETIVFDELYKERVLFKSQLF
jgi:alpha-D-xyloside xylohydrolase